MNIIALVVGILIACLIVHRFKLTGYENDNMAYPVLLATFPLYYWAFALYANDFGALLNEMLVGALFIGGAWLAYKSKRRVSLIILAVGFVAHGVYDVAHHVLYNPSVAPAWWPEFCGAIDILLGLYVLWLANRESTARTAL